MLSNFETCNIDGHIVAELTGEAISSRPRQVAASYWRDNRHDNTFAITRLPVT